MNRRTSILSAFTSGIAGRVCLVLAAMCSLYLASISLSETALPGCDESSPCYSVLGSRWSLLFGIPASFPAIAIYLITVLAAGAFESREHRTWLGLLGEVCVILIAVSAVWFIGIELFAVKQLCFWCNVTHGLALAGVFCLTWQRRSHPAPDETQRDWAEATVLRRHTLMGFTRLGAVAAGITGLGLGPFVASRENRLPAVVASTTVSVEPTAIPADPVLISFAEGKIHFEPNSLPMIGEPNAKQFAAVLMDYTNEQCRQYAVVLEALVQERGPDFAVVQLPGAKDDNASLIHHSMLCLFKADPAKHQTLSQQLLAGTHSMDAKAVRLSAEALMGQTAWQAAENQYSTWATKQILSTRQLQQANQKFANSTRLPQLLAGNQILVGFYESTTRLNAFIESSLMKAESPEAAAAAPTEAPSAPIVAPAVAADIIPAAPQLAPQQKIVDVGVFEAGQSRNCEVKFTNSGERPMKITWVGLDAGCELLQMPQDVIAPGGTASLSIKVHAPQADQLFLRQINLHSAEPQPLVVKVQGKVGPANPAAKPDEAAAKSTVDSH